MADLHLHSTFSDGSLDITTVAQLASSLKLGHIAVTDHDTLNAAKFAKNNPIIGNVKLISALELSAFDYKRNRKVHILCYCPNFTKQLADFCDNMFIRRQEAYEKTKAVILSEYPKEVIEIAEQLAKDSKTVYKQHIIHALFHLGYTDGIFKQLYKELFDANTGKALIMPDYFDVYEVLNIVKSSGATAVLAHPSVYDSMELCEELAQKKLIGGVEINHPRNKKRDKAILQKIAKKHNLIVTGGTDFHGMYTSKVNIPGNFTTDEKNLRRIIGR